jgi:hypothetical protein
MTRLSSFESDVTQIFAKIAEIRRELPTDEDRRRAADEFQHNFMASRHSFGGKSRKASICRAMILAITKSP